jgi:type II secretory pathway predicted ATPase ExeA
MTSYLKFWNVEQPVFNRPRNNFWVAPRMEAQLQRLEAFCLQDQSCALIIGESGSGKSSLARWLYRKLDLDSHEVVLTAMARKEREGGWLLPQLAELLEIPASAGASDHHLVQQTLSTLDQYKKANRRLLVLIDAVHHAATADAFEDIVTLLNAQSLSGEAGCLSFVLLGLPAVSEVLKGTKGAEELLSRINLMLTLEKGTREDTSLYIHWCLAQAEITEPVFDLAAIDLAHLASRGSMSILNALCENTLMELARRQERLAESPLMNEMIRQLPAANGPWEREAGLSDKKEEKWEEVRESSRGNQGPSGKERPVGRRNEKSLGKVKEKEKSSNKAEWDADPASIRLTSLFKSNSK